jgi:hypothetical protein
MVRMRRKRTAERIMVITAGQKRWSYVIERRR